MVIAGVMLTGLALYIYKPTYSVTLNNEFIGYTQNKSQLQLRINEAMRKGDGENIAFMQIDNMPEYNLCLLKRDVETNDEEIYNKVVGNGTVYYRYYAILEDGEEKYNVSKFEEAEDVIQQLKDKESTNSDKITILEKYDTAKAEFTDVETCVASLYKKKVVKVTRASGIAAAGVNTSGEKINLGISLIRPVSGVVTSRFGGRWGRNHNGIDIGAPKNTPIQAVAAGVVTAVVDDEWGGGYGRHLLISHGNGVQTLYGHCSSLNAYVGQEVSQGQVIGYVGSTGRSSGNHLHLEIRVNGVAQNPQNYLY